MCWCVQAKDSGSRLNTRVQPDGSEQSSMFEPGQSFIEGASEPHDVQNTVLCQPSFG